MSNHAPLPISLNASHGSIHLETFKEGLLSRMGHDLMLDVKQFELRCEPKSNGAYSLQGTLKKDSFEVIEPTQLSTKDRGEIQKNIRSFFKEDPSLQGTLTLESPNAGTIQGFISAGKGHTPISLSFSVSESQAKGKVELSHSALNIKPFRAPLGVIRLQDRVVLSFSLDLSALLAASEA